MTPQFEMDKDGKIITHPMTGFSTSVVEGMAMLLSIEYLQDERETATRSIQFALTPQGALYLAEKLKTVAQHILEDQTSQGKPS